MEVDGSQILLVLLGSVATAVFTTVCLVVVRPMKKVEKEEAAAKASIASEQAEQWRHINDIETWRSEIPEDYETKENAARRLEQVWKAIDTIREAVADLSTVSAGQYVTRQEFGQRVDAMERRLMDANAKEIQLLKELIKKTDG